VRHLFVMRLADRRQRQVTQSQPGHAAMWPHWQPTSRRSGDALTTSGPADRAPVPPTPPE
jgi:hypothetical protein